MQKLKEQWDKMKIAVAMSGGVDSSVAAAMLLEQGHQIFGVTMRHYEPTSSGFNTHHNIDDDIKDAQKICDLLRIEHRVIHLEEEFKKIVIQNFIEEYKKGRTPNPCTLCNPTIKWGVLLKKIFNFGFEKIATGHYLKIKQENDLFRIFKAKDVKKDQSYMLWRLNQEQLGRTLFPLAMHEKKEIREIANSLQLSNADKSDSQEICFIAGHYSNYLQQHLSMTSGDIVLEGTDKVIGNHKGLPLYTIGQRKGLNTPWKSALYVTRIDIKNNILYVTDDKDLLLKNTFTIDNVNWISGKLPQDFTKLVVQIRYNSKPVKVKFIKYNSDNVHVTLQDKTGSITPGQSAVFYKGDELLGGGIIQDFSS